MTIYYITQEVIMGRKRRALTSRKLVNKYSRKYGIRPRDEGAPSDPAPVVDQVVVQPEPAPEPVVEAVVEPEPAPEPSPAVEVKEVEESPLDRARSLVKKTRSRRKPAPKTAKKADSDS
jgi:hypothetical protein